MIKRETLVHPNTKVEITVSRRITFTSWQNALKKKKLKRLDLFLEIWVKNIYIHVFPTMQDKKWQKWMWNDPCLLRERPGWDPQTLWSSSCFVLWSRGGARGRKRCYSTRRTKRREQICSWFQIPKRQKKASIILEPSVVFFVFPFFCCFFFYILQLAKVWFCPKYSVL